MKLRLIVVLALFVLASCTPQSSDIIAATPSLAPTTTLPPVVPTIIRAPSVDEAASAYLATWKAEDYPAMYAMLTRVSQDALPQEQFVQKYIDLANNTTLKSIDFELLSTMTNPTNAQVNYRITYHLTQFGDLVRENTMNLSMEGDQWRVQWDDALVIPDVKSGNKMVLDLQSPTRGNIYDRNGDALAVASDIFALGIVKGQTDPEQEGLLLSELSRLTDQPADWIRAKYDRDTIYDGTYIPIGEVTRDEYLERYNVLSGIAGLYANEYSGRFYTDGGVAPHVIGYVGAIQAEEKDDYLRQGFRLDDRVGRSGVELWGQPYLLGQRSATLYITDANGSPITQLARVEAQPSQSIYLTIDRDLQIEAQKAMAGFSGAIVVLERDTGRVLAMVSSPSFDPNAFEFQNYNSGALLGIINGDGRARQFNRATSDGYPLGSVFKIISMATALETGLFGANDTYDCQHFFTEIPGVTLRDWTYDKEYDPSGVLTLQEGLMRSCNPWFYRIGMELYRQGRTQDLSNMARAFGLGSVTGIEGVAEQPGNIPDATDELENARISIGQSDVLVNPLQVARFVAAVGNGGTLYRPQVIEQIADPDGNPSVTFAPDAQATLPISAENLEIIQEAMRWVVSSDLGTAKIPFSGFPIPVYGKTGTAESDLDDPHAWFAAYTDAGRADKADIAIAVIAEYAGEGSDIAAPIARRVLEVYYLGQPQRVYEWESRIYITRTPTSESPEDEDASSGDAPSGGGEDPAVDPGINLRTATPQP